MAETKINKENNEKGDGDAKRRIRRTRKGKRVGKNKEQTLKDERKGEAEEAKRERRKKEGKKRGLSGGQLSGDDVGDEKYMRGKILRERKNWRGRGRRDGGRKRRKQ